MVGFRPSAERPGADGPDGAFVAAIGVPGHREIHGRLVIFGVVCRASISNGLFQVGSPSRAVGFPMCVLVWLPNRVLVVVVPWLLREQEDALVCLGAAVGDGLRHGVGLRPDDFLAEIPAVCLEGKGDQPRYRNQVFLLDCKGWDC